MTTIVHTMPPDGRDDAAFEHSVAIAKAGGAKLISVLANAPQSTIAHMPDAGALLERWGDSADSVDASKTVHNCCDDPVETILDCLRTIEPDLVVTSSRPRSALARIFTGSRAEAISRNIETPTLLMPPNARPFVASGDGSFDLHRILVPIGGPEEAAAAIEAAAWFAELCGVETARFRLVHVGSEVGVQTAALETRPGWTVERITVERGSVADVILEQADDACVVVMATRGHDSVLDVLFGSSTEQVLHRSARPILSVSV